MTKGDWIRSMNDENLAIFIVELVKERDIRWLEMLHENDIFVSIVSMTETKEIEGCLEMLVSEIEDDERRGEG